jgi:hypothetical protein
MNKFVTLTIALAVVLLAFLAVQQRAKTKAADERASASVIAARSAEAQAKANEEAAAQKENDLRRTQAQLDESTVRLAKLNASAASQAARTNRPQSEIKSEGPLIKDAETRALMRKQQLQQIRKQVDRFVDTNLMARLSLTDEQTSFLKELVMKKHSGHSEFMAGLMTGELEGDAMRQAGRQVKEQLLAAEQEIRQFLGPERYEAFLSEEKAQEFRTGVKTVSDELKKSGHEFSAEQREQLLATMLDERRNFPYAAGFGDPMTIDFENFHDHFSDANLDRYLNDVQAFNERVRQRAAAFLTPEQIEEMKSAQQNHLEQAKITVKLTNALFTKRRTN